MKIINLYNYYADYLGGGTIIPDELDYLISIVEIVGDYFSHSDFNFYITNKVGLQPETDNNIIFLSGSESDCQLRTDKFKLCFSNFPIYSNDPRYLPFPLGLNKFVNRAIKTNLSSTPFSQRRYKCFFAGFIHPSRLGFADSLRRISGENCFHFASGNNLQSFDGNLSPDRYLELAADSKIMLCPAGGLHTTSYRYFESLYCKNIAIYQRRAGQTLFYEAENPLAYPVDSWSELTDSLIDDLISRHTPDLEKDFENYFRQKTSKLAVSNYIIKIIESLGS